MTTRARTCRGPEGPAHRRSGWGTQAAALLATAALAAGCATAPNPLPTADAPWVQGRLSVRAEATAARGPIAETAAFELQGDGSRGELRLNSPLGTRVAAARWDALGVELESPRGRQRFADLDALSRELLGEALPLAALPDWLAGRPWGGAPSTAAGADGFEQLGWRVVLARRDAGWVEAHRATPPAIALRVRLEPAAP